MLFVELLAFWVSSRLFFNRKVLRRDDVYPALCYVINYLEKDSFKIDFIWDFPDGPGVKTLCFLCTVQCMLRETRSSMPHSTAEK